MLIRKKRTLKMFICLIVALGVLSAVFSTMLFAGAPPKYDSVLYITFKADWPGTDGKGIVRLYNTAWAMPANIKARLNPGKLGDLKYKILDQREDYTYVKVKTANFGEGWAYVGEKGTNDGGGYSFETVAITKAGSMGLENVAQRYTEIFGPNKKKYTTKSEALSNMVDVNVKVWRYNSSTKLKYSTTHSITLNKNVASNVKAIFAEIYSNPEKFPIKDAHSFRWPDAHINHPSGTGIDINWEENNYLDKYGNKVGDFWKPGVNMYSITRDGSVVRAFKHYGWEWGGDWQTPKDYMHFSYLGG